MIYFTSDLHFGHNKILEYCPRPFPSVTAMNAALLRRWQIAVRPTDTVYVLGDLSLMPFKEFLSIASELPGKKILIRGNHDSYSLGQYEKLGFQVFDEVKLKLCGRVVRLSHYPYALPWYKRPFAYKSELRFLDKRPPRISGEILLHGHTHTQKVYQSRMIHVGVDAWNYAPVPLARIESIVSGVE